MHDSSDLDLLREYAWRNSEAAFAELVRRHIALVYSAALRHVGTAGHAEEITQAVFIILARKAGGWRTGTILEGWLYETTRLTALSFLRGERRRQFREQEAYMESTLQESTSESAWNQISPLLDEAMSRLGKEDRDAVVLRFFKDRNLREVAAALQVSEAAAQRRILRALEKLRRFFANRGVDSTTAVIAETISSHSVEAAPAALAIFVTAVAIAKGAAASGSTLTLTKGVLKIMAWTKVKTAVVVGAGILLAIGTTTITVKKIRSNDAGGFSLTNSQKIVIKYQNSDPQFRQYMTRVNELWKIRSSKAPDRMEEFIKGTRELIKDYPDRPNGYQGLMSAMSDYQFHGKLDEARALAKELGEEPAPDEFKQWANGFVYRLDSLGKPVALKFVALDGREVDLEKMRGKVVLVLFWEMGFEREISWVKAAFDQFHAQGFEVVGIYGYTNKDELKEYIKRHQISWPWYFDDQRRSEVGDKISVQFGIDGVPSMFLVDKAGCLRFDNVRATGDFENKIAELLSEK
jgi:RNA polymerase sigma factor (sigma-70 family)